MYLSALSFANTSTHPSDGFLEEGAIGNELLGWALRNLSSYSLSFSKEITIFTNMFENSKIKYVVFVLSYSRVCLPWIAGGYSAGVSRFSCTELQV